MWIGKIKMGIKNLVVKTILKTLVSNYFNSLKLLGYKLEITDDKDSYVINAKLPKESINELISKIKNRGDKNG